MLTDERIGTRNSAQSVSLGHVTHSRTENVKEILDNVSDTLGISSSRKKG